jgi:hypothetical protein
MMTSAILFDRFMVTPVFVFGQRAVCRKPFIPVSVLCERAETLAVINGSGGIIVHGRRSAVGRKTIEDLRYNINEKCQVRRNGSMLPG